MYNIHQHTNVLQIRFILQAAKYFKIDQQELLDHAKVSIDDTLLPNAPVPVEQAIRLWDAAEQLSGDPLIALKSGGMTNTYQQSHLFSLACASKNLMDASQYIVRYEKNYTGIIRHNITINSDAVTMELITPGDNIEGFRSTVERHMSVMVTAYKIIIPPEEQVNTSPDVYFRHQAAAPISEYQAVLGKKLHFNHDRNILVFSLTTMLVDNPLYNPDMEEVLLEVVQRNDEQALEVDSLITQVEKVILNNLHNTDLNIHFIAKQFSMGPRTLQRRLSEENTSFNVLLNKIRNQRAMILISDPARNMSQITQLLGFQKQSALNQAFSRWHGTTPKKYRQKLFSKESENDPLKHQNVSEEEC